ncbi:MAG: phospholipase [Clostridiaceae bacterium]|jgi:NTE family protein|nr:phospholipase [Clostridiaceae bacterium]
MNADGVFEGGGVKAIGFVGAICKMEESGFTWKRLAGTSAGAIIASLLAVGYSGNELKEIIPTIDYLSFIEGKTLKQISFFANTFNLLIKNGFYSGDKIESFLNNLFEKKSKTKFKHICSGKDCKLKVIVSDITRKKAVIFPDDFNEYNIDASEFSIARAVRMSISLPYYFQPIRLNYQENLDYMVDGGIFSNFPVWIFDVDGIPRWPTIGFKLVDSNSNKSKNNGILTFTKDLLESIIDTSDETFITNKDKVRTIKIPTLGVKTTEFNINKQKCNELYISGYNAAENFLKEWNFNEYIRTFRKKS